MSWNWGLKQLKLNVSYKLFKQRCETSGLSDSGEQQKSTKFFSSEKIHVSHTKKSFKAAVVHMAVNHAISLRFFSEESFQLFNGEIARKLKVGNFDQFINKYRYNTVSHFINHFPNMYRYRTVPYLEITL